jgi:predicted N-acetyltransferase YhbS
MEHISIKTTTTRNADEYTQVWQLREDVLRKPIGMSLKNEDLSGDADDLIFIALHKGDVVGCLMLHHVNDTTIKLRQMAVGQNWQGRNIGRMLVGAAERHSAAAGYHTVVLHARMVAAGFYDRLGYTPMGDQFTEVGMPHVVMQKYLL